MTPRFKIGLQVKNEVVEIDSHQLYSQLKENAKDPKHFSTEHYSIFLQSLPNYIRETLVNWADLKRTHKTHLRITGPTLLGYLDYAPMEPIKIK